MDNKRPDPATHLAASVAEVRNIPGLRPGATRPIERVGVIGAGTMGGGIAMNFANAGIRCVLVESSDAALDRGLGLIRGNYETSVQKGRISADDVERRMGLLSGTLDFGAIADCDLIIEAVYEDLDLKKEICARLGASAKSGAIIASNTSTLDVDVLAAATGRPSDVVGMHFFSPANVMKLLEVVRGAETAGEVLATVVDLATRIGKVPVVSGVCYGFIGNRMAEVYMREAEFLLMEGASPAKVDEAVEGLGMAMGPCRMLDMAGIDVGAKTVIEWKKTGGAPADPSYRAVVDGLYQLGRHGQKTGEGYYRYEGRTPIDDPPVAKITASLAKEHGIARRDDISDEEIVERLLYPLVNEACKILEEGISYRPGDIDVVWAFGYGFPKEHGGPLYWAEATGLSRISARLAQYAEARGNEHGYWTISPLLLAAAASGRPLAAQLLVDTAKADLRRLPE